MVGRQVYFKVIKRILPSAFPIASVLPSCDSAREFSEPAWNGQRPRIIQTGVSRPPGLRGRMGPGPSIDGPGPIRPVGSSIEFSALRIGHPWGFKTLTILTDSLS